MDAIVTVDLGFGDSGKGTMVDYLCESREADWVVRYNGGAQCAHNVKAGDFQHCFSQFGSGSRIPKVKTYLSRHVLCNPISLIDEARILKEKGIDDAFSKVWIDPNTPIITPYHVWANRARERARGLDKHGSCGKGIGELAGDIHYGMNDVIRAKELHDCRDKLEAIRSRKLAELKMIGLDPCELDLPRTDPLMRMVIDDPIDLASAYSTMTTALQITQPMIDGTVVFEGAQGILLDEWFGTYPFNTWSSIAPIQIPALLDEMNPETCETIGIMRAYMTRHGKGPLPTEVPSNQIWHNHECNCSNKWQDQFRFGWPDFVLWDYALQVCEKILHVDSLAVTCLDTFNHQFIKICNLYKIKASGQAVGKLGPLSLPNLEQQIYFTQFLLEKIEPVFTYEIIDADDFCIITEKMLEKPIRYRSFGPDVSQKVTLDISGDICYNSNMN